MFCQIHCDLARAHHVGGAPGRKQVRSAYVILPGDHALDVLDLDPLRFLQADQVICLALGHFQRHRLGVGLECASRRLMAPSRSRPLWVMVRRQIIQRLFRHVEARVMDAGRRDPRFQDTEPQFFAERSHFHDEAAGQPCGAPGRRGFRGSDGGRSAAITTTSSQRRSVHSAYGKTRLGSTCLQELQIVDNGTSMPRRASLKASAVCVFSATGKAITHEFFGGQIETLRSLPELPAQVTACGRWVCPGRRRRGCRAG